MADTVNEISGKLLKNSVHYIRPMLSCAPHAISRTLDRLRVRPDHGSVTDDDLRRTALPSPGSFVPVEDHHLLREDFEEFDDGEYVGYELDDEAAQNSVFCDMTIVYAIIIKKTMSLDGQSADDKKADTNRLLMVNVCQNGGAVNAVNGDRRHSGTASVLTESYLINIGDDKPPVVAQSTSLYKFHRVEEFAAPAASPGGPKLSPSGSSSKSLPKLSASVYADLTVFEPETPKPMQLMVYNHRPGTGQDHQRTPQSSSIRRGSVQNGRHDPRQFEFDGGADEGFLY